jgi:hypothetical protein
MSFPTVLARQNTPAGGNVLSHPINLPPGIVAGELLVAFVFMDGAPVQTIDTAASGGNWQQHAPVVAGSNVCLGTLFWKIAEGGDVLRLSSNVIEATTARSFRISGFNPQNPLTFTHGTTFGTAPRPPSHTPDGGEKNYLWFAARVGDGGGAVNAYPAGYSNGAMQQGGAASGTTGTAERLLAVETEHPGAFTWASGVWGVEWTVAIWPFEEPAGGGETPRKAVVVLNGVRQQIPDSLIGTGAKPLVLMPDGSLRIRTSTEGRPLIYKNGRYHTLDSATESLLI